MQPQSKAAGCTAASSWLHHIGKSMQRRQQNQFKKSQAEIWMYVAHGRCAVTSRTVSVRCSHTAREQWSNSWPEVLLCLGWWTLGTPLMQKGVRGTGPTAGLGYCHSFFSPPRNLQVGLASLDNSVWNGHRSTHGVYSFLNRERNPGILSHLLGKRSSYSALKRQYSWEK